mgnify:CR=1 FL=1
MLLSLSLSLSLSLFLCMYRYIDSAQNMKREASRVGIHGGHMDAPWGCSFSNCVTRRRRARERETCTRNISTSFRSKVTATFRFRFAVSPRCTLSRERTRAEWTRNDACRVPNRNKPGSRTREEEARRLSTRRLAPNNYPMAQFPCLGRLGVSPILSCPFPTITPRVECGE